MAWRARWPKSSGLAEAAPHESCCCTMQALRCHKHTGRNRQFMSHDLRQGAIQACLRAAFRERAMRQAALLWEPLSCDSGSVRIPPSFLQFGGIAAATVLKEMRGAAGYDFKYKPARKAEADPKAGTATADHDGGSPRPLLDLTCDRCPSELLTAVLCRWWPQSESSGAGSAVEAVAATGSSSTTSECEWPSYTGPVAGSIVDLGRVRAATADKRGAVIEAMHACTEHAAPSTAAASPTTAATAASASSPTSASAPGGVLVAPRVPARATSSAMPGIVPPGTSMDAADGGLSEAAAAGGCPVPAPPCDAPPRCEVERLVRQCLGLLAAEEEEEGEGEGGSVMIAGAAPSESAGPVASLPAAAPDSGTSLEEHAAPGKEQVVSDQAGTVSMPAALGAGVDGGSEAKGGSGSEWAGYSPVARDGLRLLQSMGGCPGASVLMGQRETVASLAGAPPPLAVLVGAFVRDCPGYKAKPKKGGA